MLRKDNSLFIVTCNKKPFYRQLVNNDNKFALTVMNKRFFQIRLKGKCREIGKELLGEVYENNPEFKKLDLEGEGSKNLSLFIIEEAVGEIYDLNGDRVKMQRARFNLNNDKEVKAGFYINNKCINCKKCTNICPFDSISDDSNNKQKINPRQCDECGRFYYICPVNAIEEPEEIL